MDKKEWKLDIDLNRPKHHVIPEEPYWWENTLLDSDRFEESPGAKANNMTYNDVNEREASAFRDKMCRVFDLSRKLLPDGRDICIAIPYSDLGMKESRPAEFHIRKEGTEKEESRYVKLYCPRDEEGDPCAYKFYVKGSEIDEWLDKDEGHFERVKNQRIQNDAICMTPLETIVGRMIMSPSGKNGKGDDVYGAYLRIMDGLEKQRWLCEYLLRDAEKQTQNGAAPDPDVLADRLQGKDSAFNAWFDDRYRKWEEVFHFEERQADAEMLINKIVKGSSLNFYGIVNGDKINLVSDRDDKRPPVLDFGFPPGVAVYINNVQVTMGEFDAWLSLMDNREQFTKQFVEYMTAHYLEASAYRPASGEKGPAGPEEDAPDSSVGASALKDTIRKRLDGVRSLAGSVRRLGGKLGGKASVQAEKETQETGQEKPEEKREQTPDGPDEPAGPGQDEEER